MGRLEAENVSASFLCSLVVQISVVFDRCLVDGWYPSDTNLQSIGY